jgi:hypothetical protein
MNQSYRGIPMGRRFHALAKFSKSPKMESKTWLRGKRCSIEDADPFQMISWCSLEAQILVAGFTSRKDIHHAELGITAVLPFDG